MKNSKTKFFKAICGQICFHLAGSVVIAAAILLGQGVAFASLDASAGAVNADRAAQIAQIRQLCDLTYGFNLEAARQCVAEGLRPDENPSELLAAAKDPCADIYAQMKRPGPTRITFNDLLRCLAANSPKK